MKDKCEIITTSGFNVIRRITLMLVILNLNIALLHGTESIWVRPFNIKFNYEAGQTNDALTIRKADGTAITNPEWASYHDDDENENFAYIKAQSNRKIRVTFDSNCQDMHLVIKLTVTSGTGIGGVCNLFVCNYHQLGEVELTLNGTLPYEVGKRTFTWRWEIYGIPVNEPGFCAAWETTETTHTYYTLFATPQAPMAEPWSSVLDLACVWAANSTTEQQVLSNITTNAYNYFGQTKQYSPSITHTNGSTFSLTGFFSASFIDCQDMSAVVQVFTWMLGGTQTRILYINNKTYGIEDFHYKKIKPIGSGWIENGLWNFHQVGWLANVYDACIKLNYYNERIPVNEGVNGSYKSDLYLDIILHFPGFQKLPIRFILQI